MMAPQKKVQNMIKAPRQSKTHFPSGDPTARPLALLLPPVITQRMVERNIVLTVNL